MTQIALPDGSIVNFPDDMSDNDIKNVLRRKNFLLMKDFQKVVKERQFMIQVKVQ